ncbi:MAG: GNAT family N-acetyltransferase [Nitrososphaerota archaeon]|nr:GNAT family N-acetyltransferase [Nitrososphaerota archaeon]MDG7025491.1 GNAT family N-acetyltransferase [Nitrososphaerota archaeon]
MSFIKGVWGGHDYIPKVWDDWVRDRASPMYVVEVDGVPVGMNRLRLLDDGSAWLEGVRVHPAYRGRGLATMLGENSLKVARRRGATGFKLASDSRNRAAHRQISRLGFTETARFSVYTPSKGALARDGARLVRPSELDDTVRLIRGTKEFELGRGVYWDGWRATTMTHGVTRGLVDGGEVWRLGRAVAVARLGREGRGVWEQICFLGGEPPDAVRLARCLLGREMDASERWAYVPQRSRVVHALRASGFVRHVSMVLFEREAAKG